MNRTDVKQVLERTLGVGLYEYGFCDFSLCSSEVLKNFPYGISVARKLDDAIVDELVKSGPTRRYYDHYYQVNQELSDKVKSICAGLNNLGFENLPIKPTVRDDELDENFLETLRLPFSHKMAATRAGLGWIGKTDLLVSKRFGPRVRLATVLTKDKLADVHNICTSSLCGKCDLCVKACPADAANNKLWNVNVDRDDFFDAHKCLDKCRELTFKNLSMNESLCGICMSVCPVGVKGGKKPT